ncbi:MAG: molybdopterin-dependent oxidoreductase [Deltaproteobacteria bacterium]|nr:molybdopterin-dependent oxidoreductase [Deltaproteobacteria bacterium]
MGPTRNPAPGADGTHLTTCPLCEAMCGIRVEVSGGRVREIRGDDEDPFSRGHVCPKALALKDLHEDPDRLRRPLRREGSRWHEVGWDEALDEAAARLHRLQAEHGRDAVGVYFGNPTVHNLGLTVAAPFFLRSLRTRNRFSATSVDQLPHMLVAYHMWGHQLLLPVPDLDRTDCLVVVGGNPLASNGSLMTAGGVKRRLQALQARGGRLVVVDPRRTETARLADQHLFIRPGTDALLLLALVHVLCAEDLVRPSPALRRSDGHATLAARAAGFPPERVAAATGVPAGAIRDLARTVASAERAVVYGRMGVSTQAFGALCQWLINAINLLTGNLDRPGGALVGRPAVDLAAVPAALGVGRGSYDRWRTRVRGLPEFGGEVPVATLAEEILTPGDRQIRGLVTVAGNPVLSTPNGRQLDRALAGLETYVAVDLYLNETTRHAHLILPPPSQLERDHFDLALNLVAVRNTAKYSGPVLPRGADARHDHEILFGLVERLEAHRGGGRAPWRRRLQTALLRRLGPAGLVDLGLRLGPHGGGVLGLSPFRRGLTVARLLDQPHGVDLGPQAPSLLARMPRDRRIDLAPAVLLADVDRLEAALPGGSPGSASRSAPVPAAAPLVLVGRRHLRDHNTWLHNVPGLVTGRPRCTLLVHPDDAAARGLVDGAPALVRSRVSEVTVPVEVSDEIMPGVVSLPHGWGHDHAGVRLRVAARHAGASLNDLTDHEAIDPLGGTAVLNGTPVTVMAAAGPGAADCLSTSRLAGPAHHA